VLASWKQTYISTNAGTNPANTQVQNPVQPVTGTLLPFVGTLAQRTIPQSDLYYPHLDLLSDTMQYDNGVSDYNSLKVTARHYSQRSGLFFSGNYTWSKSTDTGYTELQDAQGFSDNVGSGGGGANGPLDLLNDHNNKKLSYSDVPHRVVLTGTYELPFGPGRQLALSNKAASMALRGWQVGSVFSWQRGFPLSPTALNGGSLNLRPDRNPGEPLTLPKKLQGWYNGTTTITLPDGRQYRPNAQTYLVYNPDAFTGETLTTANGGHQTNLYWWGNAALDYGGMRGPGRSNIDLTLSRNFRFRESYVLYFMANVTNALNHTQFRPGSYTMGLGSIQVSDLPASGVVAGESQTPGAYGSHNLNTFDPRQVVLEMRLRF